MDVWPTAFNSPIPAKLENPYAATYAHFLKNTENHQLTVIQEQGLYRHLRMHDPEQGSIWSWSIVTWPGYLTTVGDVADGYTFSRIEDMIEFFSVTGRSRDYYSDGAPSIDFRYWAEKLRGRGTIEVQKYSPEIFLQMVQDHLDEDQDLGIEARAEHDKIVAIAKRVTERHGVSFDDYLRDLQTNDGRRYGHLEVDENSSDEYEYFGLGLPKASPAERCQEILESARWHAESEHEARDWLSEHEEIFGQDTWEWDLRDYDVHFLNACWAIDKTVQAYLEHRKRASEAAALEGACEACGVWICDDCGDKRHRASRFSIEAQLCPTCKSPNGHMRPIRHTEATKGIHDSTYEGIALEGLTPRYPLNHEGR